MGECLEAGGLPVAKAATLHMHLGAGQGVRLVAEPPHCLRGVARDLVTPFGDWHLLPTTLSARKRPTIKGTRRNLFFLFRTGRA